MNKVIIVVIDETDFMQASQVIDDLDPKMYGKNWLFNSIGHEIIKYAAKGFDIP